MFDDFGLSFTESYTEGDLRAAMQSIADWVVEYASPPFAVQEVENGHLLPTGVATLAFALHNVETGRRILVIARARGQDRYVIASVGTPDA